MVTDKIIEKLKEKCGDDQLAFETLLELIKAEDQEIGKVNIHCKEIVEKYAKESDDSCE